MNDEKEFLKNYDMSKYERPSVTADVAAFRIVSQETESYRRDSQTSLALLLIRRGGHPFKGKWALPGGFLQPDETIETCAFRETEEETAVKPAALMSLGVFSEPGRDPRGWIISNAFVSVISDPAVREHSGDDAEDAGWFAVSFDRDTDGTHRLTLSCGETVLDAKLRERSTRFGRTDFEILDSGGIAFDHASIIASALTALRNGAADFDFIFDFLPEKFTLTQLQNVQETIMNISVLPANFRRKISPLVTETDEYIKGAGHRPAQLFVRKK